MFDNTKVEEVEKDIVIFIKDSLEKEIKNFASMVGRKIETKEIITSGYKKFKLKKLFFAGSKDIKKDALCEEFARNNVASIEVAEFILENQSKIPESWRKYDLIFKTIFISQNKESYPYILILSYIEKQKKWYFHFGYVGGSPIFPKNTRMVCLID